MDYNERIRETHRPDWLPVLLGVTSTLAVMGVLSMVGIGLRLLTLRPHDSIAWMVFKIAWVFGSVFIAGYIGGFVTGLAMGERSRVAAAMDGLLTWGLTIVLYGFMGWFGYSPLPGVVLNRNADVEAFQGLFWMAMMYGVPLFFALVFGAMHGNDYVGTYTGKGITRLPDEQAPVNARDRHIDRAA